MSDKLEVTINGDNVELKERIDSLVPPIDPNTGKPYLKINENAWDGEWVAGEVQPIPDSEFGGSDE